MLDPLQPLFETGDAAHSASGAVVPLFEMVPRAKRYTSAAQAAVIVSAHQVSQAKMEGVRINFSGGNINIYVEQSSAHTTTITAYIISWQVWGSLLLGLLVLFIVLRGRRRSI